MKINPLMLIDGYKADHRRQYPDNTELVYSNFTPRSTKHAAKADGVDDKVVFFGLQYFIKEILDYQFKWGFFMQNKEDVAAKYKRRMDNYLGKDSIPVDHIEALWDLGYLPISIRALPEGVAVDAKVPLFTIENTKPEFFWLTNYLETILSNMNWKSCTSATTARKYLQLLNKYSKLTGADPAFTPFQCHDFSFRGTSGIDDAVMSGAAHLLSFSGTDTIPAIDFLEEYYNADSDNEVVGVSIPATEHSVMCMGADLQGNSASDLEVFKRLITDVYPNGMVSIVSDSFDFWRVVTEYLPLLKNVIMARDGKLVIRPDSGDPVKIILGDPDAPKGSPEYRGVVELLWETFGGTVTDKGYKVLDQHIGVIYGDSITLDRCESILKGLWDAGFASSNVVFGIGSYTYEYVTRDTLGFAMKATAGQVNGVVREIFKDPKTDVGALKKSARGFLKVELVDGDYVLKDRVSREEMESGELIEVYRDGELLVDHTLSEIRQRVKMSLEYVPQEVA